MKVICAPDSFKESICARDAAEAMASGVRRAWRDAQIDLCPIGDGGEGTVDALVAAWRGRTRLLSVTGPLGTPVDAQWGVSPDGQDAVIEMAAAAGLALVPTERRDPTKTTTFGVGQLIAEACAHGVRQIIVGIGGSATTDGGCGMAQALGVRFHRADGTLIDQPITGQMLASIDRIDVESRRPAPSAVQIVAACDVTNPLTGPNGAAHIYGPQKGATPRQVEQLDAGLKHLAAVIRRDLGADIETTPGAGAVGGLGAGLIAFAGATWSGAPGSRCRPRRASA